LDDTRKTAVPAPRQSPTRPTRRRRGGGSSGQGSLF
jgi:hypothetical protein